MTESQNQSFPQELRAYVRLIVSAWERFFFTPTLPHTLAVIRIATGLMLAYSHLIWLSLIGDFMGPNAWINQSAIRELHSNDWGWSWLFYVEAQWLLVTHQLVAIAVALCMALGFCTRIATTIALWLTLMVCHRMTGALFGLDQILVMLTTYLMISNCGSVWSIDGRLFSAASGTTRPLAIHRLIYPPSAPHALNTISTRLIQIHLCIIYLFGGMSKLRGPMWYDGSALWYTAVNYEYQSLDITWLGHFPLIIAALTAATIFWETFYCLLIWPKLTRPLVLLMACLVHGGIAICLGMITFGTIMLVANVAFIQPDWLLRMLGSKTENQS